MFLVLPSARNVQWVCIRTSVFVFRFETAIDAQIRFIDPRIRAFGVSTFADLLIHVARFVFEMCSAEEFIEFLESAAL